MASYGKQAYWDERYKHETDPCDWITGWSVFEHLLTPPFLNNWRLVEAPGGEILVYTLNSLPPLMPEIPEASFYGEEDEHVHHAEKTAAAFPPREATRVLNVGCGNSQLSEHMLHRGFKDIVNIDFSSVVIEKMKKKYNNSYYKDLESCMKKEAMLIETLGLESRDDSFQNTSKDGHAPSMSFEHADIVKGLGRDHPDGSFDLIICKKTMDVILCGAGSVADARALMSECYRLLNKDHGVLMIISSAKPEDRAVYFEHNQWSGVLNIKLPFTDEVKRINQKKGQDRKKIESYAYILYKGWGSVTE